MAVVSLRQRNARRALLDPQDPMSSARALIVSRYTNEPGERTVHYYRGDFWEHTGSCYQILSDEEVRSEVWRFLDQAERMLGTPDGKVKKAAFNPNHSRVANVCEALAAICQLDSRLEAPFWLAEQSAPPAGELMAVANGLLHVPTGTLYRSTANFFGQSTSGVVFNASAPEPKLWLNFLREVFGTDNEAVEALQNWFGYVLTPNTSLQKLLLIVGPPRSGKGTIARVLTGIVGDHSVAAPTIASLSAQFGLSALIGKPVAIISDARFGQRSDPATVAERLLSISGEDAIGVARKFKPDWTGRLPTRFMLLTNELPHFNDSSGAISKRFIVLQLIESFLGREDPKLSEKLITELPGILNWARIGYGRLQERGFFVQPASAKDAIETMESMASPIGQFIRERCRVAAGLQTTVGELFQAWENWCLFQNRRAGTAQTFGRDLRAALPHIKITQPRHLKQKRVYEGIGLRP